MDDRVICAIYHTDCVTTKKIYEFIVYESSDVLYLVSHQESVFALGDVYY